MLLFIEGFDHYGDADDVREGPYASINTLVSALSTTQARTGTRSFEVGQDSAAEGHPVLRRALGADYVTVGSGAAFYLNQLSTEDLMYALFEFRSAANLLHYTVLVDTTGRIVCAKSRDDTPDVTSSPIMTAGAWTHVEAKCVAHATAGSIEVKVNGATVAFAENIDTLGDSTSQYISGLSVNCHNEVGAPLSNKFWIDDWFAWNDEGSSNSDFIGDHRVFTAFPTTETSAQDHAVVGASDAVQAVNTPDPDDASYLEAAAAAVTEVGFDTDFLPPTIATVDAVQVCCRMRKTASGPVVGRVDLVSSEQAATGAERQVAAGWSYYDDLHEGNPAGGEWTPAEVEALVGRIVRVS